MQSFMRNFSQRERELIIENLRGMSLYLEDDQGVRVGTIINIVDGRVVIELMPGESLEALKPPFSAKLEDDSCDQEYASLRKDSRFMSITKFAWDEKVSHVNRLKAALAIAVEALESINICSGVHLAFDIAEKALDRIKSKED